MKFGRNFTMTVNGQSQQWVVDYPLTVRFDIERHMFASINNAKFSIYNLNAAARKDIYFDRTLHTIYKSLSFNAGYGYILPSASLPLAFKGNITKARTRREGVDLITDVECFDGGYAIANGLVAISQPAGWKFKDVFNRCAATLPMCAVGSVADLSAPNSRGITLNGNTWQEMQNKLTPPGCQLFIDNETVNIVGDNDVVSQSGGLSEISSDTGLVSIPVKEDSVINCTMLFAPELVVGQQIQLLSTLNPWVNGFYKIWGLHHHGVISGAVGEAAYTDVALWAGTLNGLMTQAAADASPFASLA